MKKGVILAVFFIILLASGVLAQTCYRDRPQIINNRLVADNGVPLRGEHLFMTTWGHANVNNQGFWLDYRNNYGMNAMRLLNYNEPFNIPGYNCPTSTQCLTVQQQNAIMDDAVAMAKQLGMYVIVDYHPVGDHDQSAAMAWWNYTAPRYKDETHVIYEAINEPVGWAPLAYSAQDKQDQTDLYNLIRGHAPNTPIILWSFANADNHMLSVVGSQGGINYANAAVGFHPYHSSIPSPYTNAAGIQNLLTTYPGIVTEVGVDESNFASPGSSQYNSQVAEVNGRVSYLENQGISWFMLKEYQMNTGDFAVTWAADPFAVNCQSQNPGTSEICTGGVDEDNDGAVDCADSDCSSHSACQTPAPPANPLNVPGTVEAEDYFDYFDTTSGNDAGSIQDSDDVETEVGSEGTNVGWINAGEWLEYDINVATSGNYDFRFRVSSGVSGTKTLHVEVDGVDVTGPVSFGHSDGWQTWHNVFSNDVFLNSGAHTMRIVFDVAGQNFNYVEIGDFGTTSNPEICTGGVDEDNDGAVDCADSDCSSHSACQSTPPTGSCSGNYLDCFTSTAYCGERPGPQNTGPSNPGILTNGHINGFTPNSFGQYVVTQNGAVLENFDIQGSIKVQAQDVTIRNFRINGGYTGGGGHVYGIFNTGGNYGGLVVEDGEILGVSSSGVLVNNAILRRLNIHHTGADAFKVGSGAEVYNSYMHHLGMNNPSAHADGFQSTGGSNGRFECNFVNMPPFPPSENGNTFLNHAGFIFQSNNAPVTNSHFVGNWIRAGTYDFTFNDRGNGPVNNMNVHNNIHYEPSLGYGADGSSYGVMASNVGFNPPALIASGNIIVNTDSSITSASYNNQASPVFEVCDNGSDDDSDGAVDCNDNDCTNHASCQTPLPPPSGNEIYIRQGATGDGSDWNNALGNLPSTLERGKTYYFADGNYGSYTFDDSVSGTNQIILKKAVEVDHGTSVGWQSSYGNGQAEFGTLNFNTDYVLFDGQTEYGFKLIGAYQGQVVYLDSDHITIRHTEIDGNFGVDGSNYHNQGSCSGIYLDGNYQNLEYSKVHNLADDGVGIYGNNIKLIGNKIHNLHAAGTDAILLGPCFNGHSDGIEVQGVTNLEVIGNLVYDVKSTSAFFTDRWPGTTNTVSNLVLKNNIFYTPHVGLVMYLDEVDGVEMYNNVIWGKTNGPRFGGLAIGANVLNMDMYNNIILNINFDHMGGAFNPAQHNFGNNLYAMLASSEYSANPSEIVGNPNFVNIVESSIFSDHLVDVVIEDFNLQSGSVAINAGSANAATPLDDILGNLRDSQPDIGPIEFGTTVQPSTCAFTDLSWSTTSATQGDVVQLNVLGDGCTNQDSLSFQVYERSPTGLFDRIAEVQPVGVNFDNNAATTTWTVEYNPDLIIDVDPEYYFVATINSNSVSAHSGYGNLLLEVTQAQGVLSSNVITQDNVQVEQDGSFTYEIVIDCTGGTCGDVEVALDPFLVEGNI